MKAADHAREGWAAFAVATETLAAIEHSYAAAPETDEYAPGWLPPPPPPPPAAGARECIPTDECA